MGRAEEVVAEEHGRGPVARHARPPRRARRDDAPRDGVAVVRAAHELAGLAEGHAEVQGHELAGPRAEAERALGGVRGFLGGRGPRGRARRRRQGVGARRVDREREGLEPPLGDGPVRLLPLEARDARIAGRDDDAVALVVGPGEAHALLVDLEDRRHAPREAAPAHAPVGAALRRRPAPHLARAGVDDLEGQEEVRLFGHDSLVQRGSKRPRRTLEGRIGRAHV